MVRAVSGLRPGLSTLEPRKRRKMDSRELVEWKRTSSQMQGSPLARFPDARQQARSRAVPLNPLQRVVGLLHKYVWTIVLCVAVAIALTVLYAARQPRLYRATANIAIYRESGAGLPVVKSFGTTVGDADEYSGSLETQIQILHSRSLASAVVRELGLARNSTFLANASRQIADLERASNGDPSIYSNETVAATLVLAGLSATPVKNTRVVEVSFTGADRRLNARIVNALLDDFIEDSIRSRYEASSRASKFLSGQLTELRAKVEESQQKLVTYEREHDILMVDDKQNVTTSKLDDLNKQLTAAEEDRMDKEATYQTISAGDLDRLPESKSAETLQNLLLRDAELKSEYAQATTIYGLNHPRVIELTNRMQAIDISVQAERKRLRERCL